MIIFNHIIEGLVGRRHERPSRMNWWSDSVWRRARTVLAHDPALAPVIASAKGRPKSDPNGTHYAAVLRAIVYQQLSGKAAATIHARLIAAFGERTPPPDELAIADEPRLRAVGLSRQKIGYLRDLATKVASGALSIDQLDELDDEAVITALASVKGVGRWTAQMFLMFRLGRTDVLPIGDLAIRNAMCRLYRLRGAPKPERLHLIAEPWRPFRSVACWYLWRSLEVPAKK